MEALRQAITSILVRARDDIRTKMQAQGVNASGRTSASLQVRDLGTNIQLVGGGKNAAPIPTLEVGRPGGRVPKGFYYIIKQWTRDKGLQFATEAERSTFSYFVARKIAAEGTFRHTHNIDVYTTIAQKSVNEIRAMIVEHTGSTIKAAIAVSKIK